MIIKRKRLKKYQPNGYSEVEDVVKNSPGFHSTSTSYESYKTFSDDDLARDKQDLQNYIVGGGLGVGAGVVGGKVLKKNLDKRAVTNAKASFTESRKKYKAAIKNRLGIDEKQIRNSYQKNINSLKDERVRRVNKNTGFIRELAETIDNYVGKKELKHDLDRIDNKIKNTELTRDAALKKFKNNVKDLKQIENNEKKAVSEKLANKLKRNKKIGKGISIGGALALGGLGVYGMHKHNQKVRGRKNHGVEEENNITSALRNSSDMVASGKLNPQFHKFHNPSKEKKENPITETKESIINSLKSGNTDDLKDKFNKFKNTVANAVLIKNIGNGLKSGFSGFGDNIKRNILGNDK